MLAPTTESVKVPLDVHPLRRDRRGRGSRPVASSTSAARWAVRLKLSDAAAPARQLLELTPLSGHTIKLALIPPLLTIAPARFQVKALAFAGDAVTPTYVETTFTDLLDAVDQISRQLRAWGADQDDQTLLERCVAALRVAAAGAGG